jgi:hypothetical protein
MPQDTDFQPSMAVRILSNRFQHPLKERAKIWALSGLMGWIFLDKQGGTSLRQTKQARRAGQLALCYLIDQHIAQGSPVSDNDKILFQLLLKSGGLFSASDGLSTRTLLRRYNETRIELEFVHAIVDFIVRCSFYPNSGVRGNIKDAYAFMDLKDARYGPSKIEKMWLKFRRVAAYVYAFRQEKTFSLDRDATKETAVAWISTFPVSQRRVDRLLGRAAAAMDIISKFSTGQSVEVVKDIQRVDLNVRPFSEADQELISKIDHKSSIGGNYRPKVKRVTRRTKAV